MSNNINFNDWRDIKEHLSPDEVNAQLKYIKSFLYGIGQCSIYSIYVAAKTKCCNNLDSTEKQLIINCKSLSKLYNLVYNIKNHNFKIWQLEK